MPTSDEELAAQAEKVEGLRAEVAQTEADRTEREAESANDVTMLQLQAEEARLEAQLITAKAREDAIAAGDYVDSPIASAQAELRLAVAQQEAAQDAADGKVPDPPPENPPVEPGAPPEAPEEVSVTNQPPPSSPVLPPMPESSSTVNDGTDS